jgi:beta-lactamase class C
MCLTKKRYSKTSRWYQVFSKRNLVALTLLLAPFASADPKRVTVPLTLPFQQQASVATSSASAAASSSAYGLQTTQFTQSATRSQVTTLAQQPVVADPNVVPAVPAAESPTSNVSASSPVSVSLPSPAASVAPEAVVSAAQSSPASKDSTPSHSLAPAPIVATAAASGQQEAAQAARAEISAQANQKSSQSSNTASAPKAKTAKAPAVTIPLVTTAPIKAVRQPVGHPDAFVAEFEDYVAKKIAPFVPGVSIVVVSGGQIKSMRAFGVRRAGTREQMTPDTVYRLASLSKPVASTAASVLVNEGLISWDTTITSVLPKVAFKNSRYGNQLTLRHALSQSTGMPRHTYSHYIDQNMDYADAVQRLRYVNFACAPGKCYAYQNVVYSLAGEMIKAKSGTSFEFYVGKKVFEPLGMRTASYGLASYNASPNRASPHIANGNRWIPTSVVGNWYKVAPAAGVNASIVDMSKFLLGQLGRRPEALPLSVLKPIQSRVTKNKPEDNYYGAHKAAGNTAYGLGWRVFDYGRNKNFVHHGGHVKGFRTEMVFNRDLQIGMVFLTNSETRLARDVIFKFLDMHERAQQAAREAKKK